MRPAGTESGLLGFCRKLSREVLQFADPLRPSSGGKIPRSASFFRRLLQIEPLEARNYLNGTSVVAQVDPVWFQEVAGVAQSHAGTADWTAEGISASNNQQTVSSNAANNIHDWIVQFDTRSVSGITDIAQTAALLAGGGIQFQAVCGLGIVGQVLVRSSGSSLDSVEHWLAADSDVAGFEEDAVRQIEATPNDPALNQLWSMSKINAYGAWNLATGGGTSRVVVAEIDTGVDYTHPDLAANVWTNPNAGSDGFGYDLHGYDFANNDSDPMDDNGHGTHVAGTIGAVGNNGLGVAGVNWAVSIMPLKFMTAAGSGYLSDAVRAINYATMERTQYGVNVRVINASWGGGGFSAAMQSAIQAAGNAGILFVAAAGNDAANNDAVPHYPAGYNSSNIIAVAATDQYDRLASFSCYGATSVDLAAPGVSIYSTLPGGRYGVMSGTSMATPHVAGAAALAWALDPTATVAEIRNALLQGADKLGGLSGKVASGGRLDVLGTLRILQGNYSAAPTIGALAPSANNVPPGTSLDLIATGAAAPAGAQAVYFYADINNNGVFDANDFPIGADYSIQGGTASIHFLNTNWAPGTYRFFARTLDANYQFSAAAATTITISATGMSSFTLSANNVVAGTSVTLVARGLPTGSGLPRRLFLLRQQQRRRFRDHRSPHRRRRELGRRRPTDDQNRRMAAGNLSLFRPSARRELSVSPTRRANADRHGRELAERFAFGHHDRHGFNAFGNAFDKRQRRMVSVPGRRRHEVHHSHRIGDAPRFDALALRWRRQNAAGLERRRRFGLGLPHRLDRAEKRNLLLQSLRLRQSIDRQFPRFARRQLDPLGGRSIRFRFPRRFAAARTGGKSGGRGILRPDRNRLEWIHGGFNDGRWFAGR